MTTTPSMSRCSAPPARSAATSSTNSSPPVTPSPPTSATRPSSPPPTPTCTSSKVSSTTPAAWPEPYKAPTQSSAPSARACNAAPPARPSLTAPATSSTRCKPPGAPLHRPGNPSDGRRTRPAHHQGQSPAAPATPRHAQRPHRDRRHGSSDQSRRPRLAIARITSPNDKPSKGTIRAGYLGHDRVGSAMTRADIAAFLVDQLTDTTHLCAAPAISN